MPLPEKSVFFEVPFKDIDDLNRHFILSKEDIQLINPNTLTCPIFRTKSDAEITKKIYRNVPVIENETTNTNLWNVSFMQGLFNMSSDSNLFYDKDGRDRLPLYEAKMLWHFHHRYGDYADYPEDAQITSLPDVPDERLADPNYTITPRYWVDKAEVESKLLYKWDKKWLIAFRDITNATNERTAIFRAPRKIQILLRMTTRL